MRPPTARSVLPQDSLPRLKVPDLASTLDHYLRSAAPILSPDELVETTRAVQDFKQGDGPRLQAELEQYAAGPCRNSSYISEPWYDMCVGTTAMV